MRALILEFLEEADREHAYTQQRFKHSVINQYADTNEVCAVEQHVVTEVIPDNG